MGVRTLPPNLHVPSMLTDRALCQAIPQRNPVQQLSAAAQQHFNMLYQFNDKQTVVQKDIGQRQFKLFFNGIAQLLSKTVQQQLNQQATQTHLLLMQLLSTSAAQAHLNLPNQDSAYFFGLLRR